MITNRLLESIEFNNCVLSKDENEVNKFNIWLNCSKSDVINNVIFYDGVLEIYEDRYGLSYVIYGMEHHWMKPSENFDWFLYGHTVNFDLYCSNEFKIEVKHKFSWRSLRWLPIEYKVPKKPVIKLKRVNDRRTELSYGCEVTLVKGSREL